MKFLIATLLLSALINVNSVLGFRSLRLLRLTRLFSKNSDPARLGGPFHPCLRKCVKGDTRLCYYNFTVSETVSMGAACGNCPAVVEDCYKRGCIMGGGHNRLVTAVNLMIPGPSIQVCEGDRVQVDLYNVMDSQGTTVHWHGMWQRDTPFMDGTPYLTQCPIHPHNIFKYEYTAFPAGTNMWHSHIGYEEADGMFGSLIVRKANDPLAKYYDYDSYEHIIVLWHWLQSPSAELFARSLSSKKTLMGYSLLVNGLSTRNKVFRNGTNYTMPRAIFHVNYGRRHRFRTIFNTVVYCPVEVSIDNHKLLMIASDADSFEPIEVDSYMFNAGERYDFVLHANQKPGNYWIRFRGMGLCEGEEVVETAILHYKGSILKEPVESTSYAASIRRGVVLNPVEIPTNDYTNYTLIPVSDLRNIEETPERIKGKPDHVIYLVSALNSFDEILHSGPYPQFNNLSFEFPPVNLLTQYKDLTPDMFCTPGNTSAKQCQGRYCTCPMIHPVKKNSLVEVVFIDSTTAFSLNHPMHLHGFNFYVVAEGTVGLQIDPSHVKSLNEKGLIKKNFHKTPAKDTVMLPSMGYVILRFYADNPGYWFFHCHIGNHAEMGMGVTIKVGEHEDMIQPPSTFPRCGSWELPKNWKPSPVPKNLPYPLY